MSEAQFDQGVAYVRSWVRSNPGWHRCSAEQIADMLANDADWTTIRLGGWLQSPDGELIERIVQAALPYPVGLTTRVLVDGIKLAANQQTERRRLLTVAAAVAGAALIWFLATS
ncbi:MAG TPA: hypothetical protein VFX16_16830 [Pseudonocardiaceae bacterium]|nr:hypothetical protein [Pseudonocardiaceae bacterium]